MRGGRTVGGGQERCREGRGQGGEARTGEGGGVEGQKEREGGRDAGLGKGVWRREIE